MIYHCKECDNFFEEEYIEKHYEKMGDREVLMSACPYCSGGAVEEAKECKLCGDYVPEGDYCEACKAKLSKRFQQLLDNAFSEEERKALNYIYDGWEF